MDESSANINNEEKITKYDYVAPDGGYGYVICLSLCVNFICCFCHSSSFGMQYNDFFINTGSSTGSVTMVLALSATVMSFCGVLVNVALKKYSARQVALVGALLYTAGWFLNVFVTSVNEMFLTIGFLQGSGVSVLTTISFTSFNQYFEKNRLTVLSLCQVLISLAQIIYPLFLEKIMAVYGFRGSLLINASLFSHTIFAAVCFQPVEWHLKKVPRDEMLPMELMPINTEKVSIEMTEIRDGVNSNIADNEKCSFDDKKSSIWRTVSEQMDLSLLSDAVYVNITLGMAVSFAGDIGFSMLYPLYLYSLNYSTSEVAFSLALVSAADLTARVFVAIAGHFRSYPSRNIFFTAVVGGTLAKFFFLQSTSYWPILLTSAVAGFCRGPMQVTMSLVYAEYLPEKFAAAYGVALIFMGNANTLIFPAAGFIRDLSGSYPTAFYFLILITVAAMIPWCYEYWYFGRNKNARRNKKKSRCNK